MSNMFVYIMNDSTTIHFDVAYFSELWNSAIINIKDAMLMLEMSF